MQIFTEASNQDTRGNRGKTTAKRARTTRGPEGAWIAQVNEELAAAGQLKPVTRTTKAQRLAKLEADRIAREAYWATLTFRVMVETTDRGQTSVGCGGEFATHAEAEEAVKGFPLGHDRSFPEVTRTRVWIEKK